MDILHFNVIVNVEFDIFLGFFCNTCYTDNFGKCGIHSIKKFILAAIEIENKKIIIKGKKVPFDIAGKVA